MPDILDIIAKPDADLPLFSGKNFDEPSIFKPENLLCEARRQKELGEAPVPEICVLDPDGDSFGIIACAVGAFFAVLLAEQLLVSGT